MFTVKEQQRVTEDADHALQYDLEVSTSLTQGYRSSIAGLPSKHKPAFDLDGLLTKLEPTTNACMSYGEGIVGTQPCNNFPYQPKQGNA